MEAFATVAQYKAKYATSLTDAELSIWLADASDVMRGEMDGAVDWSDPSEDFEYTLMSVCRDVAHRAIGDDGDDDISIPCGATQVNMTGGSYSRGFSFGSAGYSDLFLTGSEKARLGIGVGRACVLSPYGGD